jgi:transposase, IS30 family
MDIVCLSNNFHPIASINGSMFLEHELIAKKLNSELYSIYSQSFYEMRLNEYINKLIRQYIIKGNNSDL